MGKKHNGEYNDFLDGEKLRDNGEIRTSLQAPSSTSKAPSPPPTAQHQRGSHKHSKPKNGPKKPQLTHFLCLPLVTASSRPQLQTSLDKLKTDLEATHHIPPKAIRPIGTLHLTLGVMSLDPARLEEAKHFLAHLSPHRILRDLTQRLAAQHAAENGTISENLNAAALPDTDALTVNLEGLTPMHAPARTSVLFATPRDATQRLEGFAAEVRRAFVDAGFLVEDTRPLKLHATVVNTIYAKERGARGRKSHVKEMLKHVGQKVSPHHHEAEATKEPTQEEPGRSADWQRFDARELVEKYKDVVWAEGVRIDKVQICRMGAGKVWSSGVEGEGEVVDERYEVVGERRVDE